MGVVSIQPKRNHPWEWHGVRHDPNRAIKTSINTNCLFILEPNRTCWFGWHWMTWLDKTPQVFVKPKRNVDLSRRWRFQTNPRRNEAQVFRLGKLGGEFGRWKEKQNMWIYFGKEADDQNSVFKIQNKRLVLGFDHPRVPVDNHFENQTPDESIHWTRPLKSIWKNHAKPVNSTTFCPFQTLLESHSVFQWLCP